MNKTHGFTFLELIIFLFCLGILIFLSIPFLRSFDILPSIENHNRLLKYPNDSTERSVSSPAQESQESNNTRSDQQD